MASVRSLLWIWIVPFLTLPTTTLGLVSLVSRSHHSTLKPSDEHAGSYASNLIRSSSNTHYSPTSSRSLIEKEGGAVYRQSILTTKEFSTIKTELSLFTNHLNDETTSTVATNRQGASLDKRSETVKILQEGSLSKYVQKVTGDSTMRLSSNLPVEVRLYEKAGSSMAWHEDDVLYDPPQVEAVVTIENSSDCVTVWKKGDLLKSQETDPNSVLLLKAGGPLHCVTSLKRGRRLILKCAYRTGNATFRKGLHKDQFGTSKRKCKKQKGTRRKGKR
eukprot:scaffold25855_cov132-Cylindrotheca_fusiformis.AAC.2